MPLLGAPPRHRRVGRTGDGAHEQARLRRRRRARLTRQKHGEADSRDDGEWAADGDDRARHPPAHDVTFLKDGGDREHHGPRAASQVPAPTAQKTACPACRTRFSSNNEA